MKTGMKVKLAWAAVVIGLLLFIGFSWWRLPIHVAYNLDSRALSNIEVYDKEEYSAVVLMRTVGEEQGPDNMGMLLEKLSGLELKRSGLSFGMKEKGHKVILWGNNGKAVDTFYVKSDDTIIKGPFVYKSASHDICYEDIENLF